MSFFGLKSFRQSPEMCQILLQPAENRTTFHTNALAHFTLTLPENDGKLRAHQMVFCTKRDPDFYAKDTTLVTQLLTLDTGRVSNSNPNEKKRSIEP